MLDKPGDILLDPFFVKLELKNDDVKDFQKLVSKYEGPEDGTLESYISQGLFPINASWTTGDLPKTHDTI